MLLLLRKFQGGLRHSSRWPLGNAGQGKLTLDAVPAIQPGGGGAVANKVGIGQLGQAIIAAL